MLIKPNTTESMVIICNSFQQKRQFRNKKLLLKTGICLPHIKLAHTRATNWKLITFQINL